MKKLTLFCFLLFSFSFLKAQYTVSFDSLIGQNPNSVNQENNEVTSGALSTNWTQIIASSQSTPIWSPVVQLPFAFNFNGNYYQSIKVSSTGILTFDTAASIVPGSSNGNLPNSTIPDNSVCIWGINGSGANDACLHATFGNAPNRQFWVFFSSYSTTTPGWTYWSIVLEEGTNNIYVVDQRSNINVSLTIGVQINATTAYQHPRSPNIPSYSNNSPDTTDNSYYTFSPFFIPSWSNYQSPNSSYQYNWHKSIKSTIEDLDIKSVDVDSGIVIGGMTEGNDLSIEDTNSVSTLTNASSSDLGVLAKLNANGAVAWKHLFSGSTNSIEGITALKTAPNGDVVFGGYTNSNTISLSTTTVSANSSGGYSLVLGKLTAAGNVSWLQTFASTAGVDSMGIQVGIDDIEFDSNGNILVSGYSRDTLTIGGVDRTQAPSAFVAKFNSSGNFQWYKASSIFGRFNSNKHAVIAIDPSDQIFCLSSQVDSGFSSNIYIPPSNWSLTLTKFDQNGSVIWEKPLTNNISGSFKESGPIEIEVSSNGNLFVMGTQKGSYDFGNNIKLFGNIGNSRICFLAKLDANGNTQSMLGFRSSVNVWNGDFDINENDELFYSISVKGAEFEVFDQSGGALIGLTGGYVNAQSAVFGSLDENLIPFGIESRKSNDPLNISAKAIAADTSSFVVGGFFEDGSLQMKSDLGGPVVTSDSLINGGYLASFGHSHQPFSTSSPLAGAGDTLFKYDFNNGIPQGWQNIGSTSPTLWEYRGPNTTPDNTVGSQNTFSGSFGTIQSQTPQNGFMIFDSHNYANTGISPAPHAGNLITSSLDFSGVSNVTLQLNSFFNNFGSAAQLVFSYNNGLSYPDTILVHPFIGANQNTLPDEVTRLDISQFVSGKSNVKVGFLFNGYNPLNLNTTGSSYYFWMVDDIFFLTKPKYDAAPIEVTIKVPNSVGQHSTMPYALFTPWNVNSRIANYGADTLQNAKVKLSSVTTTNNNIPDFFSEIDTILSPGDSSGVLNFTDYPYNNIGSYNLEFLTESDSIDDFPFNDTINRQIDVSLNQYRLHRPIISRYVGTYSYVSSSDSFLVASQFPFPRRALINDIEVTLGPGAEAGGVIIPQIMTGDLSSGLTMVYSGSPYTLTPQDTVNLSATIPVNHYLDTGVYYIGLNFNSDNDTYPIEFADDRSFTQDPEASIIVLGGLTNGIAFQGSFNAPHLSLNVDPYQDITFQVNMENDSIATSGVYLEWIESGQVFDTLITNLYDSVYAITLPMLPDQDLFYRFRNGNTVESFWDTCLAQSPLNDTMRSVFVELGTDTLQLVCFNSCQNCNYIPPPQYNQTFSVNMRDQSVSPNGVYLEWLDYFENIQDSLMTNTGGDTFSVTLALDSGRKFLYRFRNGLSNTEFVPSNCDTISDNNFRARNHQVLVDQDTLDLVCFNACSNCLKQFDLTIQVNMAYEVVSPQGVYLRYQTNGVTKDTLMINTVNDIYVATIEVDSGFKVDYNFINGTVIENPPTTCASFLSGERELFNVTSDDTLDVVCFDYCTNCAPRYLLTMQVNMAYESVSPQGVFLRYQFKGVTKDTLMVNTVNDIYVATIEVDSGFKLDYNFINGMTTENPPTTCASFLTGKRELFNVSQDDTLDLVCFDFCTDCAPKYLLTMRVDMKNEPISPQGVFLKYQTQGVTKDTLMVNTINDIYVATIEVDSGFKVDYNFINGNIVENPPSSCSSFLTGERELFSISADDTLDLVCFSFCTNCAPKYDLTFSVNMEHETISPLGVYLRYQTTGITKDTLMVNTVNDVYVTTIAVDSGFKVDYNFINGNIVENPPSSCSSFLTGERELFSISADDSLDVVCFSGCTNCPPQYNVTFGVNMQYVQEDTAGVFLEYWYKGQYLTTPMLKGADSIYRVTLLLDSGLQHAYRFRNGLTAFEVVPSSCNLGSAFGQRRGIIPSIPNDTITPVCFSSCTSCPIFIPQYDRTFAVNMKYENISPDGVFLEWVDSNQTIQDTALSNFQNDVYGITLTLDSGSTFQYRFRNGLTTIESIPFSCGALLNPGDTVRESTISTNGDTLDIVCFSLCTPCLRPAPPYNVTFTVNMFDTIISPNGVFMEYYDTLGNMVDTQMTNIQGDIYSTTVVVDSGSVFNYRFRNGLTSHELIPSNCNVISAQGDTMRQVTPTSPSVTYGPVCYRRCVDCKPPTTYDITFEVDMQYSNVIGPIYVSYLAPGNVLVDSVLTNTSNQLYSTTLTVDSGYPVYYRFKNDTIFEDVPYQCNTYDSLANKTRSLVALQDDTVSFCWEACTPCIIPNPCNVDAAGTITSLSSVCLGDQEVQFSINPIPGAFFYYWYFSNGNQQIAAGQGTTTIRVNMNNPGASTLAVYGTDESCNGDTAFLNLTSITNQVDFDVTVNQTPNCGEPTGELEITNLSGATNYNFDWTTGDSTQIVDSLAGGFYEVTVTGNNGCSGIGSVQLVSNTAPQLSNTVSNPTCYGDNDGFIDLTITGGTPPYKVKWLTGQVTEDLGNLEGGGYFVEVTDDSNCVVFDCIEVIEPAPIEFNVTKGDPKSCSASNGFVAAVASGGTGLISYNWSNGNNTPIISGLSGGVYSVTATDGNGCTADSSWAISEEGGPIILVDSIFNTVCNQTDGEVFITLRNSVNPIFTWSTGDTTEDISNLSGDQYWLEVQDSNCVSATTVDVIERRPEPVDICLVTVNDSTQNNIVVWDKTAADANTIGFNIYRESCVENKFIQIGSTSMADYSDFMDVNSNTSRKSWKYKISAVDACGNESFSSPFHKTLHAKSLGDTTNGVLVGWNPYVGFNYNWYFIERFTPQSGWTLLDSVPTTEDNFIDVSPQAQGTSIDYSVYVKHPVGCISYEANKNHNSSRANKTGIRIDTASGGGSNPNDTTITDTTINDTNGNIYAQLNISSLNSLTFFPNPAQTQISFIFDLKDETEVRLSIFDARGQLVIEEYYLFEKGLNNQTIKLDDPPSGVYTLLIEADDGILRRPLIISR